MGKTTADTAKWLSAMVAIVGLTAAGVAAHYTARGQISEVATHCGETARRLTAFENDSDMDFEQLREWMKNFSKEQTSQGKTIAAIAAKLNVDGLHQ